MKTSVRLIFIATYCACCLVYFCALILHPHWHSHHPQINWIISFVQSQCRHSPVDATNCTVQQSTRVRWYNFHHKKQLIVVRTENHFHLFNVYRAPPAWVFYYGGGGGLSMPSVKIIFIVQEDASFYRLPLPNPNTRSVRASQFREVNVKLTNWKDGRLYVESVLLLLLLINTYNVVYGTRRYTMWAQRVQFLDTCFRPVYYRPVGVSWTIFKFKEVFPTTLHLRSLPALTRALFVMMGNSFVLLGSVSPLQRI